MTASTSPRCGRFAISLLAAMVAFAFAVGTARTAFAWPDAGSAALLKKLQQTHAGLKKKFADDLLDVAKLCEKSGIDKPAAGLRKLAKHVRTENIRIRTLPKKVQPELPRTLPAAERAWRLKFRKAKSDYANSLYKLSREVLRAKLASYAFQLVHETAYYDPDHTAVRRMLGYVRSGDFWLTPFEKKKARDGEVWHDKFGWLPKAHVANYEKGMEYYEQLGRKGRWVKADVAAALRRKFHNGWRVGTEHYLVITNHSLQEGVRVAKKLEEFHRHFFHIFAGFFNSPVQMRKLFAGGALARGSRTRHKVHYYRDKEEYVRQLKSFYEPGQLRMTNGLYLTDQHRRHPKRALGRVAHFFHDPKVDNTPTLYHEATHQIFYESLSRKRMIAAHRDFWIIEGISCYIESFKIRDNVVSMGDPTFPRFVAAKFRYVNSKHYVPLEKFSAMGMQAFQGHKKIQANYSQAAGLAKFFMEYDNGKYRDALIEHLSQLYRKSSRAQSLEQLTGVDYATLDRQYGEFIKNLPIRVSNQPANRR